MPRRPRPVSRRGAPRVPVDRPPSTVDHLPAKRQGELAELAFLHRAAALGLIVMKPFGDSAPYDVVVDNGSRLLKLQIKSAASPRNGVYEINAARGRFIKTPYTRRDIDFLAAYLIPEDTWYIFPLSSFSPRKTLRLPARSGTGTLAPLHRRSRPNGVVARPPSAGSRYSRFKAAWHFLLYVRTPSACGRPAFSTSAS